jgi:hypothetical protein
LTKEFFDSLDAFELKKWAHVSCIKAQLEGITTGYNKQSNENPLSIEDFYYMNTQGNFNDVRKFLQMEKYQYVNKEKFYTKENLQKVYHV